MKFKIIHEIRGRMRVHLAMYRMSIKQADILEYYLMSQESITSVKIYERTKNAAICYKGDRSSVIQILQDFSFERNNVPDIAWENSSRMVSREYKEQLIQKLAYHTGCRWLLPVPIRNTVVLFRGMKYIWKGLDA